MTFTEAIAIIEDGGKTRRPSWPVDYHYLNIYGLLCGSDGNSAELAFGEFHATDWEEVK